MSIFDSIKRLLGGSSSNGDGRDGHPADGGPAMDDVEMIPCHEALRLVHEYLDGELEDAPETRVRRHFEACGRCYPHLRLETAYRDAMRRAARGEQAPPKLKAQVLELLAEAGSED